MSGEPPDLMAALRESLDACPGTQSAPHTPPETRSRAGDTEEDDRE